MWEERKKTKERKKEKEREKERKKDKENKELGVRRHKLMGGFPGTFHPNLKPRQKTSRTGLLP